MRVYRPGPQLVKDARRLRQPRYLTRYLRQVRVPPVSAAIVIVIRVRETEEREVLGFVVGPSEDGRVTPGAG